MNNVSRTKMHLATVWLRDATLRMGFATQRQAMDWVAEKRRAGAVVQWTIEEVWVIPAP